MESIVTLIKIFVGLAIPLSRDRSHLTPIDSKNPDTTQLRFLFFELFVRNIEGML